jgi:undecaprenyl-diphosphatase
VPFLQAFVLGAVQGLTEFIPISSSGHLVIVPDLFGWPQPGLSFDVMLHLGSLVALLIYFSGDLIDLARGFLAGDQGARRMVWFLAVGTLPAVIAGLALAEMFEDQFEDAPASALQLLITAAILVGAELALAHHSRRSAREGQRLKTTEEMDSWTAFSVGVAQAIAIVPGISRSGSTIATGLAFGMRREDAARFAFLLAIPALIGASMLEIPDIDIGSIGWPAAIGGTVSSLVFSYIAIAGLIRFLKNNTLYPFAAYCLVAGPVFYLLVR